MAGTLNSDEEQYANESFERDFTDNDDSDIPELSETESDDDSGSDTLPQGGLAAPCSALDAFTRARITGRFKTNDYGDQSDSNFSSPEDDDDVIINKIQTQPMRLADMLTPHSNTGTALPAKIQHRNVVKVDTNFKASKSNEDDEVLSNFSVESNEYKEHTFSAVNKKTSDYKRNNKNVDNGSYEYNMVNDGSGDSKYSGEYDSEAFDAEKQDDLNAQYQTVENSATNYESDIIYTSKLMETPMVDEEQFVDNDDYYYSDDNDCAGKISSSEKSAKAQCSQRNYDSNEYSDAQTEIQAKHRKKFQHIINAARHNMTPTEYANSFLEKAKQVDKIRLKEAKRQSWTFTNERMREIDRQNKILLQKINSQKPYYVSGTAKSRKSNKECSSRNSMQKTQRSLDDQDIDTITAREFAKMRLDTRGTRQNKKQFEYAKQSKHEIGDTNLNSPSLGRCSVDIADSDSILTYKTSERELEIEVEVETDTEPSHCYKPDRDLPFGGCCKPSRFERNTAYGACCTPSKLDRHTAYGACCTPSELKLHFSMTAATSSSKHKPKQTRKSWSFTNERMREIDRQNNILLQKILAPSPSYVRSVINTEKKNKKSSKACSSAEPASNKGKHCSCESKKATTSNRFRQSGTKTKNRGN